MPRRLAGPHWQAGNARGSYFFKTSSTSARNSDGVTASVGASLNMVLMLALLRPSSRSEM